MVISRELTKILQLFLDSGISVSGICVMLSFFEVGCSGNF